jgi:hypothetical protein
MSLEKKLQTENVANRVKALKSESWRNELGDLCCRLVAERKRILLCVCGRTGTGKSTLGKELRKHGLPHLPARRLAVIDDSVLSVSVLGIFKFRVRRPAAERDNLQPFLPYLRRKQLIVYVNSNPTARVERCDVLLRLHCDESVRRNRLRERNSDGEQRYAKSLEKGDLPEIPADYVFDLVVG